MAYDTAAVAVHMASCNWQLIVSLYTLQMLTVTSELVSSKQQTTYWTVPVLESFENQNPTRSVLKQ